MAYNWRVEIDFTDAQVVSGTHSDFPVLISTTQDYLKTTGNGGEVTDADGYDIIFTSDLAGTNQLGHEIEEHNPVTGEIIFWVRAESLAATSKIYMWYGNSDISTFQGDVVSNGITGVWDDTYEGVWHLNEAGNGTTGEFKDSSSKGNDGTGGVAPDQVAAGKIHNANDFAATEYIDIPSSTDFDSTTGTYSAWINVPDYPPIRENCILSRHDANSSSGFMFGLHTDGTILFHSRTLFEDGNFGFGTRSTTDLTGGWHYVVVRYDGNTELNNKLFIDAVDVTTANNKTWMTWVFAGQSVRIGESADDWWDQLVGSVDEVRISSSVRSAGWIETEFNNQDAPAGFYSLGTPTATVAPTILGPMVIRTPWTEPPLHRLRSHGYTVDFRKLRRTWQGSAGVYTDHGLISTLDSHSFDSTNGYLSLAVDDDPVPSFQLNSSKFAFGAWQFCETLISIPVETPATQTWIGPSVFMGGDTADSQVSNENLLGLMCDDAGDGSSLYRVYRHDVGGWAAIASASGPDPAERPVLLRIEARDLGTVTEIDWWIDGIKQTKILDSAIDRIQHTTVSTTPTGLTSPGLLFGHNGEGDTLRHAFWFRGGNMPELPDPDRTIYLGKPANRKLVVF